MTGRTLDADGAPVGSARIVVVVRAAGEVTAWFASDASRDGTFDVPLGTEPIRAGARIELRAQAPGFRAWRGPVADLRGPHEIRLERLAHDLVPGRIVAGVRDVDGRPVTGAVAVHGYDEFLSQLHRSAWADADGRLVLEGVPPGTWSLALGTDTQRADVVVGEGADAQVELRTETRFLGEPAVAGADEKKDLAAQIAEAERRAHVLEDEAARTTDAERRVAIRRLMAELSGLHAALVRERERAAPHREVLFRGVPLTTRAWIAAPGDDGEWVVELRPETGGPDRAGPVPGGVGGAARIPRMPLGDARIEVRRLDAPGAEFHVEIVAGDGPQVVVVPPR